MSETDNPYDPTETGELPTSPPPMKMTNRIVTLAVCVLIGFVLLGLLLPATRRARPASYRMMCSTNMRTLAIALMSYEKAYGQLPPAYTVNERGQPLHSWRTLILPYLEEISLYSKIDLSVPWEHPRNDEARMENPWVFRCPASKVKGGYTTYHAVVGDHTCFQPGKGRMLKEIVDGASNTILLVESELESAIHWMSPRDMEFAAFLSQKVRPKSVHSGGFGGGHAVKANIAVMFLPQEIEKDFLRALMTVDGCEPLEGWY